MNTGAGVLEKRRDLFLNGSVAPPGGTAAPRQPFGTANKERKYIFLSKRGGECSSLWPKREVKTLWYFLAPLSVGFAGDTAIGEAFVLGRVGDEGGQELQSMAAACALTAWRRRERERDF